MWSLITNEGCQQKNVPLMKDISCKYIIMSWSNNNYPSNQKPTFKAIKKIYWIASLLCAVIQKRLFFFLNTALSNEECVKLTTKIFIFSPRTIKYSITNLVTGNTHLALYAEELSNLQDLPYGEMPLKKYGLICQYYNWSSLFFFLVPFSPFLGLTFFLFSE